jgi:hypothetical protein
MANLIPLPQGIGGPTAQQLVTQVNDRLRRINLEMNQTTVVGPRGERGPAGSTAALIPPGQDTWVIYNDKMKFGASPNMVFVGDNLWLKGAPGTGVIAPLFNSTADSGLTGTVNTAGSAVTLVSGSPFATNWAGGYIAINTFIYEVSSVQDGSHLTVAGSAGNQVGVPYQFGNAIQTSSGNFVITGAGHALFQSVTVTETFNSKADTTIVGTVNTAGSAVTLVSGSPFQTNWAGGYISLAGFVFQISSVQDASHLTVAGNSANRSGIPYQFGNAVQSAGGTFVITGSGNALFQSVTVTNTFNSKADTSIVGTVNTSGSAVTLVSGSPFQTNWAGGYITINNMVYQISSVQDASHLTIAVSWPNNQSGVPYQFGNAVQSSQGTFVITGAGHALFQSTTVTATFNSKADYASNPATTAAFQTSSGNMQIFGDGHAAFQNVAVTTFYAFEGQTTAPTLPGPTPPATKVAGIYFDYAGGALKYNLSDGKGWIPFAGAGAVAASGVVGSMQYSNGSGGFVSTTNFTYAAGTGVLTIPNTGSTPGITAPTFNGSGASGTGIAFQTTNSNFQVDTSGNIASTTSVAAPIHRWQVQASAPAGAANFAVVYYDQTQNKLLVSYNNAAFVPLGGSGGGSSSGASGCIQYSNGSGLFLSTSGFFYGSATGTLTIPNTGSQPGVTAPAFNGTGSGAGIAFQTSNSNFSVNMSGNLSAVGTISATTFDLLWGGSAATLIGLTGPGYIGFGSTVAARDAILLCGYCDALNLFSVNGVNGITKTVTISGETLTFTGGILTAASP